MNNFIMAVCPFCRKFITVNNKILKFINASTDQDSLKDILSGKANLVLCPQCKEKFYYEHCCGVLNVNKKYAVICIPDGNLDVLQNEKSAIYKILGIADFKLRYVNEFLNLIEKVRIFEYDLDDRVFEIIKYKYVPLLNTDVHFKIILSNTDQSSMEFTVFDGLDKPVVSHHVGIDAYYKEYISLEKENIAESKIQWLKIDSAWAKNLNVLRSTL